jgi:hypothetical protein
MFLWERNIVEESQSSVLQPYLLSMALSVLSTKDRNKQHLFLVLLPFKCSPFSYTSAHLWQDSSVCSSLPGRSCSHPARAHTVAHRFMFCILALILATAYCVLSFTIRGNLELSSSMVVNVYKVDTSILARHISSCREVPHEVKTFNPRFDFPNAMSRISFFRTRVRILDQYPRKYFSRSKFPLKNRYQII